MRKIYDEKKRHGSALELAKLLIAADFSWDIIRGDSANVTAGGVGPDSEGLGSSIPSMDDHGAETTTPSLAQTPNIPLFLATSHGILEIVEETLQVYPSAFEYRNHKNQNILHLAIMHRQSHIFDRVTHMETPKSRLVRQIDKNGYTILHHVGNMEFYNGGTQPGPALQLQEELAWYEVCT